MDADDWVTERPLSAGEMAVLHLGSFAVEYQFTPEHLEASQGGFAVLDDPENHAADEESVRESARILSLRYHEQDHINRLVGTTFGFLLDCVRSRWVTATARLVSESIAENREPLLPLGYIPHPRPGTLEEVLEELSSRVQPGSQLRSICRGLSDCLQALLDDVPGHRFVSALWGLAGGNVELARSMIAGLDAESRSGFALQFGSGELKHLTARHLLELFGWREQGNCLLQLGFGIDEVNEMFNDKSEEYELAYRVWRSAMSKPDSDGHLPEDNESIEWGRSFPFELFVAADLALWPPFEPPGRLMGGFCWSDVNPARRFMSILAVFRELDVSVGAPRDENLDARFRALQELVCRRMKWPTPESLAQNWLAFLKENSDVSIWHAIEPERSIRIPGAICLLQRWLDHPARVVLNHSDLEAQGALGVPLWIFQLPMGRKQMKAVIEPREGHLFQALVVEGAAHLYQGNRPMIPALEEDWLRDLAAGALAKTFQGLANLSNDDRERFGEACRKFFLKGK